MNWTSLLEVGVIQWKLRPERDLISSGSGAWKVFSKWVETMVFPLGASLPSAAAIGHSKFRSFICAHAQMFPFDSACALLWYAYAVSFFMICI